MKRNIVVAGYTGRLGTAVLKLLETDMRFVDYDVTAQEVNKPMPVRADVLVSTLGAYVTAGVFNGHVWEHLFRSNLEAPIEVIKAFADVSSNKQRLIICTTAAVAWTPERATVGNSAYVASKAAMSAFLAGLKAERPLEFAVEDWQPTAMLSEAAYQQQARMIGERILRHE